MRLTSRPEKEHYKQLHALAELFKAHPEYRSDSASRVDLVMMGSVRGEADEQRLEGLKKLAQELGVQVSLTICSLKLTIRTTSSLLSMLHTLRLSVVSEKAR